MLALIASCPMHDTYVLIWSFDQRTVSSTSFSCWQNIYRTSEPCWCHLPFDYVNGVTICLAVLSVQILSQCDRFCRDCLNDQVETCINLGLSSLCPLLALL